MRRPTLSLAAMALIAACGGDTESASSRPGAEVRDSLGVTIVENERPAPDSRLDWTLSPDPLMEIGTFEGDEAYQLYQVRDALRLSDGRIAVANGGTSEVRIYDAVGTHMTSFGREGEGPGEFTTLIALDRWAGDSIMTWDFRQRRASIFDGQGALGRTFTIEQSEDLRFPNFGGLFADQSMMLFGEAAFDFSGETGPQAGLERRDQVVFRAREESLESELGRFPGMEWNVSVGEGFVSVMSHPFGRSSRFALWDDRLVVGTTDTYELKVYDGQELSRIIRRDYDLVPVTQEHMDAEVAERIEDLDDDRRLNMQRQLEGLPLIPHFPTYGGLATDALGYLWVREYQLPGEEHQIWTIFDREGRALGLFELSPDLSLLEIGEDYVLARARDEFDVEYVRMYGLMRNEPAGSD